MNRKQYIVTLNPKRFANHQWMGGYAGSKIGPASQFGALTSGIDVQEQPSQGAGEVACLAMAGRHNIKRMHHPTCWRLLAAWHPLP